MESMSLQGNLLGSPDGDVPLVGGLGEAVLVGRAGEGLRGEGGEDDLGLVGLFSLLRFDNYERSFGLLHLLLSVSYCG